MFWYFDPMYLLFVAPALLLALWAQMRVKMAFSKFSRVRSSSGLSGAQAAAEMLSAAGLQATVRIERIGGFLSDH